MSRMDPDRRRAALRRIAADDPELLRAEAREAQRRLQAWRAGCLYAGDGAGPGKGDPGHEAEGARGGHRLLD